MAIGGNAASFATAGFAFSAAPRNRERSKNACSFNQPSEDLRTFLGARLFESAAKKAGEPVLTSAVAMARNEFPPTFRLDSEHVAFSFGVGSQVLYVLPGSIFHRVRQSFPFDYQACTAAAHTAFRNHAGHGFPDK